MAGLNKLILRLFIAALILASMILSSHQLVTGTRAARSQTDQWVVGKQAEVSVNSTHFSPSDQAFDIDVISDTFKANLPLVYKIDTTACVKIATDTTWTAAGSPYRISCDVYVEYGATLTIEAGVTVQLEHAGDDLIIGGGLQAVGTEQTPILFQPLNGTAPGSWGRVAFRAGSSGVLDHTILEYGGSLNGMVYIASDAVQVLNSIVQYSADSGIYIQAASPLIDATQILSNTGTSGGGLYNDTGSPLIQNNTFYGNLADFGGGLFNNYGSPVIQSNTFYKNVADGAFIPDFYIPGRGGGLDNGYGSPIVRNNIFASNSANYGSGISSSSLAILTLDYNDVWGDYDGVTPGAHDISVDPQFIDPDNGDFHLALDSPCIDTGDPDHHPETDFEGDSRPMGQAPDIGTDETLALRLAKSVAPDEITLGEALTYTISLTNRLPFSLTNMLLTDTLPVETAVTGFQTDGLSCAHNGAAWGGQLHCTLDNPSLEPGESRTLILTVILTDTLPAPQYVTNTVRVTASAGAETHIASDRARTWVTWCAVQLNDTPMGNNLEAAIDASVLVTDVVKVSGYCPAHDLFLDKTLTLQGGWSLDFGEQDPALHTTTLDGQSLGRVIQVEGIISPTIEGFVITGGHISGWGGGIYIVSGNPTIQENIFHHNLADKGGGLYNGSGSPTIQNNSFIGNSVYEGSGLYNETGSPTIQNNVFDGNYALTSGGGLYNGTGSPLIQNNTFTGNSKFYFGGLSGSAYGGGLYNESGNPAILNNTFSGNASDNGGGLYNDSGSPTIQNNTFTSNSAGNGGGLFNLGEVGNPIIRNNRFISNTVETSGGGLFNGYGSPVIENNLFFGNIAYYYGGGLHNESGGPVIQNNIFAGNHAAQGGGLFNYFGNPTIQNNTFTDNFASFDGGGLHNVSGSPTIRSNIVVNNTADSGGGIYSYISTPVLDYNDVWGNTSGDYDGVTPGAHDISADPLLVDPPNGDFHLSSGSPCIDKGDPVNYPPTDFEGDVRPHGVAPDIGADEYYARME